MKLADVKSLPGAARISIEALLRQTKSNLGKPFVVSVAEPLRDNYDKLRTRAFRQQIGVIVNISVTAILLHELFAFFFPMRAVPVPFFSLGVAITAEILLWLISRQISHIRTMQLLALSTFIIPLIILVKLAALDVTYYLHILIFVAGFVLPWSGLEAVLVSTLPMLGYLFMRGQQQEWVGLAADLSVFVISIAIVTSVQLKQERERRTSFAFETEAERTRRDLMESLALAAKLHKDIISQSADFPGLCARVLYESMQELGGDYVKMANLGGGRTSMLLADVTGHGPPAALLVNRVNTKVESILAATMPPHEAAEELNDFVTRTFDGTGMLMSALWAEFDLPEKKLRWSNYGHPPPILIKRKTKTLRILSSNAYVMGIDIPQETPDNSLAVEPGDLIIFYTDGLIEIHTAAGVFDLPALLLYLETFIRSSETDFSADDLLGGLEHSVKSQRIGEVKDDLLVIIWEIQ